MTESAATDSGDLNALLAGAVRDAPHGIALIHGDTRMTYGQLHAQAQALAAGLRALGVTRGSRVAIALPNMPVWVALQFACARIGAIVVAVNTRFRSAELGDILARSGAQVIVFIDKFRNVDFAVLMSEVARANLRDVKHWVVCSAGDVGMLPATLCEIPVIPLQHLAKPAENAVAGGAEDGCVMFTTSGTTSQPKLVLHTQRSIAHHAQETARMLGYDAPGSVIQVVTPLCGVSGFGMPFAAIAARAPCVMPPAFEARTSLDLIVQHRVTHVHANHEIIHRWLEAARDSDDLSSIRVVNCGSGIASVMDRAARRGIPVLSIYGSSEMQARFSRQNPGLYPERRLEAGGFPLSPHGSVRVADIDSGCLLPYGEKGELQIRAPSQMQAYFGDAKATARAFNADGFVRTGDCGYMRADGSFVLEARIGDVLKLSGFMVSPSEIEAWVMRYPGVVQCQVVGTPATQGGQSGAHVKAVAFVRCEVGASFDEARALQFCREKIAHYKVPARIVRLDEFPLTAGANAPKVQKHQLREMARALGIGA